MTTPETPGIDDLSDGGHTAEESLRLWAGDERAKAGAFADFLEGIAAEGLPAPETGRPWAEVREQHLNDLADRDGRNVA